MKRTALLLFFFASSCGSSSSGDDPVMKCQQLIDTLCLKILSCNAGKVTAEQCTAQLMVRFDCAKADSVTSSYDNCLTDARASSCAVVNAPGDTLPASCKSSIVFHPLTQGGEP